MVLFRVDYSTWEIVMLTPRLVHFLPCLGGRHIGPQTVPHPSLPGDQSYGHHQGETQLLEDLHIGHQAVLHPPIPVGQYHGHVQSGLQLLGGCDTDPQAVLHLPPLSSQSHGHSEGGVQLQGGRPQAVLHPPLPASKSFGQSCVHLQARPQLPDGQSYSTDEHSPTVLCKYVTSYVTSNELMLQSSRSL